MYAVANRELVDLALSGQVGGFAVLTDPLGQPALAMMIVFL